MENYFLKLILNIFTIVGKVAGCDGIDATKGQSELCKTNIK